MAESFEALRTRADKIEASSARPKVFLANLGPLSAFNTRATFAKNILAAGGIETISNDGFEEISGAIDAFKASGASCACICSSDEILTKQAGLSASSLKNAGAKSVAIVTNPCSSKQDWSAHGVDTHLYQGCNIVDTLSEILDQFD